MKTTNKICIVLFLLLLVFFVYMGIFAPADQSTVQKENRELAPMPAFSIEALRSGRFAREFEAFLGDKVGFRSFFVDASAKFDTLKGIKPKEGKMVTTTKDLGTGDQGDNHLLVLSDRVMEVYQKNDEARDAYISALNQYRESLPETVRLFNMLIPTQIEFLKEQTVSDSEKDTIDHIAEYTKDKVISVPAYDLLKAHKDEYLFFRTDHHWTQLGAFYGYTAFAETAFGITPQLSDYEKHEAHGFLGFLYNQAKDPSLEKHADTIQWFTKGENLSFTAKAMENGSLVTYSPRLYVTPNANEMPKYGIFMGGDHQFAEIKTNQKNGKTLLVMKDSYANTLLPFLTELYETVLVIDPRNYYGKVTDLVAEYDVDDVLIINYVFTTTFPDFIGKMIDVK